MSLLTKILGNDTPATTVPLQSLAAETADFIERLLRRLNEICEVSVTVNGDEIFFNIIGGEPAHIIGYKGETLNDLRTLAKTYINRRLPEGTTPPHVKLDTADYAKKHADAVRTKIRECVSIMQRQGKTSYLLQPMTAYDRKLAHEYIGEFGLSSDSVGEGKSRRVRILVGEKSN